MAVLRARTSDAHASVDAAFSRYDLGDRADYCAFLAAHARALPAMENIIARCTALPATRARAPLLAADMAILRQPMPALLSVAGPHDGASAWGILYVIEGSRLGGGVLAGRVGRDLPAAYLGARHRSGEWRHIGEALNAEAARHDAAWLDRAALAAASCFDVYARASLAG